MLRFLENIPIFRRLFIFFAVAVVVPAILIILLGNFFLSSLNTRGQAVQISFDAQSIASTEQNNLLRMNALLQARHYQIFASLSNRVQDSSLSASGGLTGQSISALEVEFNFALSSYVSNYEVASSSNMSGIKSILLNDNPATGSGIIQDQQQALNAVSAPTVGLWSTYQKLQEDELTQLSNLEKSPPQTSGDFLTAYRNAYQTFYNANNTFFELRKNWQRVVDDAAVMGKAVNTVGPSLTNPIIIGSLAATLITMLVIVLTGFIVNLTITNPLLRLVSLTKRIAKGDTNARSRVRSEDEIGKVAIAMNRMLDNIVHLIQEAQAQRDALQAQVEKLVSEVSGVGEGDLRIQAEVTADALGVLADSFNYMVEELSSLIVRVKMVSQEVENSTTMTFERMTHLVENADIQIQQISEAAVEVEQVADYSRQVAERAQSLYVIAREARQTAEVGRESVQQTVQGMGRIHTYVQDTATKVQALGDSSRQIDDIVGTIANIAHQTNRLALDAAIQAAMAGENGKGFGAVAADIRRLAERAKDQASTIARIVRSVREDIGAAAVSMQDTERETSSGAKLAEETGSSLASIFSVVERQGQEIETINQMAARQLQSSNTVVQIMQGVSDSTQQSSSSTREAAQNMERLARLAEQLLSSVEAFKLRDNVDYYPPSNVTIMPENDADNYMTVSGVFRTVTASAQPAELGRYSNQYPNQYPDQAFHQGAQYPRPAPSPVPAFAPSSYQQDNGFGNGYNGFSSNGAPQGRPQQMQQPQQSQQLYRPQQPRSLRPPARPAPPIPARPPEWQ
jgi:methyl-accepting chemotaxis protein